MDLNELFESTPYGWMAPKKQYGNIEALQAVGMSVAHIEFARSVATAGAIPVPEAVREMRLLSAERLAAAAALATGWPWLPWTQVPDLRIDAQALKEANAVMSEPSMAERAVPLGRDTEGHIHYAVSDPADARQARLHARELQQRNPETCGEARFLIATPKTLSTLYYTHFDDPSQRMQQAITEERWRQAMGWLLTEAVYCGGGGVENIYLEPGPKSGQAFIQVEGIRRHLHSFPLDRETSGALTGVYGRLINLIRTDIRADEATLSTPGSLTGLIPENLEGRFDFRVELKRTLYGQTAVLRPFDLQADVADIDLLGFDTNTRQRLRMGVEAPYGLIVIVGPTSSGKNTSAISMLYSTDPLSRSIQTVEHPVEVRVASWQQHSIPVTAQDAAELEKVSRTITDSLLRSAPQVIYWGECRNADAVSRALAAANTGHLTLTTYHAGDVASAILRMRSERTRAGDRIDMATVGELMVGILAQRLVRRVCPDCAVAEDRDFVQALLREHGLDDTSGARRAKEGGCPRCSRTGYRGRVLVYEWFERPHDMNLAQAEPDQIRSAMPVTLFGSGLRRVAEGQTDYAELTRVLRRATDQAARRPTAVKAVEAAHA